MRLLGQQNPSLDRTEVPDGPPNGFEDCAWLFTSNLSNRNIARLDLDEAALLFKLVRTFEAPRVMEIGRLLGGSTILLAAAVGPGGKVTSVDIAPKNDDALSRALEKLEMNGRAELVVSDANLLEPPADGFDVVFIDGDHSYEGVRKDYEHWRGALRPGGYLVFHDAWPNRPAANVREGVERLMREIDTGDSELRRVQGAGSLGVFQRI